jgi:CheY-like chemotaxis protein
MNILLVEDNESDVLLMEVALTTFAPNFTLTHCEDGEQALARLRASGAEQPDVVMLDLNLPKKNGYEVLQELKSDPQLWNLPVIVLSTTANERDVKKIAAYPNTRFATKPSQFAAYKDVFAMIEDISKTRTPIHAV